MVAATASAWSLPGWAARSNADADPGRLGACREKDMVSAAVQAKSKREAGQGAPFRSSSKNPGPSVRAL